MAGVQYEPLSSRSSTRRAISTALFWIVVTVGSAAAFIVVVALMSPALGTQLGLYSPTESDSVKLRSESELAPGRCQCRLQLCESIPEGLTFNSSVSHMTTYQAWRHLLNLSRSQVDLGSFYWTLLGKDVIDHPSDWQGEAVFAALTNASEHGIKLRVAQNLPSASMPNTDTFELAKIAGVQVRSLNFTALMGRGILHTKLWIVDGKHFYVGSANFDWRSLTQVKELGVLATDCACLARDLQKIFDVYWALGGEDKAVPDKWPPSLSTKVNMESPLSVTNTVDGTSLSTYLSSSPPPFCPDGRSGDLDAILRIIDDARSFVNVAVMDYMPATLYERSTRFWPIIDDRLRKAAIDRGVAVHLLVSEWSHTRKDMIKFLKSLVALNGTGEGRVSLQVKLFKVPSFTPDQAAIPAARVNHNKYLVTEATGFIGTSNWSEDYFTVTGGVGFVFSGGQDGDLRHQLEAIFDRDWNSEYARFVV